MHTGVYLRLNGTIIANHDYVEISDIDDTALICHTSHPAAVGNINSGRDWFAPDGTRVTGNVVPGFRVTRGPMIVRLLRNTDTDPPSEGIYICVVKNDTVYQTAYVELYYNRIGTYPLFLKPCSHLWQIPKISFYTDQVGYVEFSPHLLQEILRCLKQMLNRDK